ncbi:cache domain-containing protein [Simplicispira hankyongi]|jgi:cytochrome c|uniref:Chemotaxis protein n=1 Tax=Simplicispira hankyongi TaxID=2315688 RepID=A0A398CC41_9BURK|nr:cache domain-containing protein [Simplicispira hankyongi]MBU6465114.1 cache domain-containing protein [Burkholderiales bacterium]RID98547.1 chemotaxis protein [Simplicispira hankyongi]
MKRNRLGLLTLAVVSALIAAPLANAAEVTEAQHLGTIERSEAKRATALLDSAVSYLQKNGPEKSFAAFNDHKGPFIDGPYYVFAVGTDGFMHADGAAPALAGKNQAQLRDAAGKPFIQDLLELAQKSPTGTVEYRWLNRTTNHLENKVSLYRKVGDTILGVGYYTPRATVEDAQNLLAKAVAYLKKWGGKTAFEAFNDPQGSFTHDDQYVFVIGIDDGEYRATGASPQLTGMNVRGLRDAAGKPLIEEMINLAKEKGSGTVDYVWRNPATNAVEAKHSLIQREGDVLLGVGYYTK